MATRSSTGFVQALLGPSAFDQIFFNGCIEIYAGTQPASADLGVSGTLLARITRDGLGWTEGSSTGGLQFVRSGRYAYKNPTHAWVLKGLATGIAGWWRLRGNGVDSGAVSVLYPRIDGSVRLDGSDTPGQLTLSSLDITASTQVAINHWWYAIPPLGD